MSCNKRCNKCGNRMCKCTCRKQVRKVINRPTVKKSSVVPSRFKRK